MIKRFEQFKLYDNNKRIQVAPEHVVTVVEGNGSYTIIEMSNGSKYTVCELYRDVIDQIR